MTAQAQAQQDQANQLHSQADTLSNQLAALRAQSAALQSQIAANEAKSARLAQQIQDAEAKLATEKSIMSESIRQIYQQSQVSSLEMLASSKNFSDYIDKQQYTDRIKDHIQEAAQQVMDLQASLKSQQTALNGVIVQQNGQRLALQQQRAEQAQLLYQTQGNEAAYQNQVASTKAQLSAVVAARAAAVRSGNLRVSGGGCGPYPDRWCNAEQDSLVTDGNYYNRECVSYVAYRWETDGHSLPSGWGNASDWTAHVNTSSPHPGDIAVWGAAANRYLGGYGHVAYVESVDGGGITISQYNFDIGAGPGRYSTMYIGHGDVMWGGIGFIH